jgi:soluble lytic murein transglycosylase-like protein
MAGMITVSLLHFADRYNVDPRLVVAMILAESGFNPNATSRVGAMGLGQLMPGTAAALGVSNPYDPVQNLDGSINYLRSRLDTFADQALPGGGYSFEQVAYALAAYNAGTNAVKKYKGIPPYRETQAYVRRVMSLYQQLCQ